MQKEEEEDAELAEHLFSHPDFGQDESISLRLVASVHLCREIRW